MSEHHGVVVGLDGTPSSQDAVRWARAHADRFGVLRPVYSWGTPVMATAATPFGYAAPPPIEEMQAAATRAGQEFAESLGITEELSIVQGDPGVVLCQQAADANALVIGTRARGPLRANVLGSTGRYCADHTPVPLIIVPDVDGTTAEDPVKTVVVGIDGSANSVTALRWAAETYPDAEITAVTSWQTPIDGPVLFGGGRFDLTAFRDQAHQVVDEAADKVGADTGRDPATITRQVSEGDPRWTLQEAHEKADLLVLGQRGRTGLAHLMLGSTTTSLIHRPVGPVAVIPPESDDD